jgi:hypothetical protein
LPQYLTAGRGSCVYLQGGGSNSINWVAKADFDGEGTERKMKFYQVFLNAGSK